MFLRLSIPGEAAALCFVLQAPATGQMGFLFLKPCVISFLAGVEDWTAQ